jgi:ABC-2 type transport system permease protein
MAAGDSAGIKPWTNPAVPSVAGGTQATRYAVLPPAPLATFAVGQSDLYPYYTRVSTRSKQTFIVNDEIENPVNLLAGRFDLAFVVIYVLPLLILALSYNLVSGEREQGTLDLVLSQPVDARRVIAAKLLARVGVVLGVTLVVLLLGTLLGGAALGAEGVLPRLALWALVVGLYALFWFGAALAVSAMGRSSATNAVVLLGVWLAVVVIVPSLYNMTVTSLRPSPSRVELTTELRAATDEANEQGAVLLQKFYLDHPEMMAGGAADMDNFAARSVAVQEAVEQAMAPAVAAFDQRLMEQQALADRFRFVSPALVLQAALFDLAGTSVHRYRAYSEAVDAFHASWRAWFFPRVFAKETLTPADYDALPAFTFREEPAGAVAARVAPGIAGLLLPTVLLGVLALGGLKRIGRQ